MLYSLQTPTTESFRGSAGVIAASVGPYRVLDKLGSGGMGEVYLAEDSRLGRKVALKTISGTGARDARDRLRNEARAAATLNHPNIAAIYDVIEHDNQLYIVMEYVDGATLAQRVGYGPMVPEEALDITAQMLDALAHAHAHGVVHHDLKPANVSLAAGGKVKILDFGIARLHPKTVSAAVDPTTAGRVFGTPGYAAPEQLLGAVGDRRSDLYSVGVLLFELIAGRPPFEPADLLGSSVAATGEPPSLAAAAPHVRPALDALVARAMAPDPDRRFQSASEMLTAVRGIAPAVSEHPTIDITPSAPHGIRGHYRPWIAALSAAALLVLAGRPLYQYWHETPRAGETIVRPIVAVLPLENLTADPANDRIGIGIAETISTTLGKVSDVTVIPQSEIRESRRRNQAVAQLASDVGATFVVGGAVQIEGEMLKVTLRLMRANGSIAWSEEYDGVATAILPLQSRLGEGLVRALRVRPTLADRQRLLEPRPVDPDALSEYWQGRALLERPDQDSVRRAVASFERAIARDPGFALAHAGLADAHWTQYQETKDPAWTTKAIASSLEALRLDPALPQVRITLARVYQGTGRLEAAVQELGRALEVQPNNDEAHRLLGETYTSQGKTDDAIAELKKAIELRPNFWRHHNRLGIIYYNIARYDEAIAELTRVTELQPDSPRGFHTVGTVYQAIGDNARALQNYERAIQLGAAAETYVNLGMIQFGNKRYQEAARAFEQATALKPNEPYNHRILGDAYARLNRSTESVKAYERAIALSRTALDVNPNSASMLSMMAVCEAKLGRGADARRHIEAAVALAPTDGSVLYRQAIVESLLGNVDRALTVLQQALARGYSATLAATDEDIAALRSSPLFQTVIAHAKEKR